MIKYDRFWVTMKERGITQYDLYEHYQITRSLLDRLRKNKNVEILYHRQAVFHSPLRDRGHCGTRSRA